MSLRDEFEIVGDVRGKGLMLGMELVKSKVSQVSSQSLISIRDLKNICSHLVGIYIAAISIVQARLLSSSVCRDTSTIFSCTEKLLTFVCTHCRKLRSLCQHKI